MKLKKGTIVKVKPSKGLAKVVDIIENPSEATLRSLRKYCIDAHKIYIEDTFKVCRVVFKYGLKSYDYPISKKCLKKPLFQLIFRRKFKNK